MHPELKSKPSFSDFAVLFAWEIGLKVGACAGWGAGTKDGSFSWSWWNGHADRRERERDRRARHDRRISSDGRGRHAFAARCRAFLINVGANPSFRISAAP